MQFKRTLAAVVIAGTATGLAACGSSDDSSGSGGGTSAPAAPMPSSSAPAAAMSGEFGPACGQVPATGPGSFQGMSTAPVATAAGNNPVLSTLVSAVQKANLVDTLNSAQNITVFAPANAAFGKIPEADLNKVLSDNAALAKLLQYHVVAQRISPEQLAGGEFTTLEGQQVKTSGSGEDFTVNGSAKVVCGNVRTANATVYIIDRVLMPSAS
ncbi:lipoprotein [Amycolatopsis deserti]|uniref:Lipoprotein n=1 Tax=Amycolatopsis deserti TaxID=185696 RepID=A0ABQ3ICP9_9PSEU|nr:fasciclin domain-containing protein [Amycolatopsis deserti]GHE75504.1 lipoprotein [Amycolatopsis deserti]